VPPKNLETAVAAIGDIQQKIVVDLILEQPDRASHGSSFREIQRLLPEAKVVKITPDYPYQFSDEAVPNILYFYSNDRLAHRMVRWVVDGAGYKMIDINEKTIL